MTFKRKVYNAFQQILNDKINGSQNTLSDLRASAANETKSTAGDKHETALAMLQIEQANTGRQLSELLLLRDVFDKINPSLTSNRIGVGSLVKTNNGCFYISVAIGKATVESKKVIALSPHSPLGGKLLQLKVDDSVEVNGRNYLVQEVF